MPDTHTCPAPGCDLQVPQRMYACKRDWYRLPKHIRDEIWAGYQRDPERHRVAMRQAQVWYRNNTEVGACQDRTHSH